MRKILITVSYDGTGYLGWQKQLKGLTIEGQIERACSKVFVQGFELVGSSRTDKGVHALGQRASIETESTIPVERVCNALNSNLPDDIVVTKAENVSLDFHPRYNAKEKIYDYRIVNSKYMIPQLRNFAEFERRHLDISKMKQASKFFIGEHDFKGFCASGSSVKTTVRTIFDIDISKKNEIITMRFRGNGFLYNMVRIIAGTIVYVGLNKIDIDDIQNIIESKDRTKAGKTLGAIGLTLVQINY